MTRATIENIKNQIDRELVLEGGGVGATLLIDEIALHCRMRRGKQGKGAVVGETLVQVYRAALESASIGFGLAEEVITGPNQSHKVTPARFAIYRLLIVEAEVPLNEVVAVTGHQHGRIRHGMPALESAIISDSRIKACWLRTVEEFGKRTPKS